ncbi:glycosyltransferase [Helicobacter sp. 23-1044]
MRVLHLCSSDSGGAGRACVRLHKALLEAGIDSIMLVQNKTGDSPHTYRLARSKAQKAFEKIRPFLSQIPLSFYPKRHKDIFSPQLPFFIPKNRALLKYIAELKPDIVHLHWVESGFINIKDLTEIDAPMIWSLHDANPYTGGCHYVAAACVGVSIGCKKCPLLGGKMPYDISYFSFKRKQKVYNKINITINGLSRWIAKCAKDSALFSNKSIINLPNPIDTSIFAPIPKNIARRLLNIPNSQKIIAFGAIAPMSLERKGYDDLKNALRLLKDKSHIKLLIFGASNGREIEDIESIYLGYLSDDIALKIVYSVADVVLMPSHIESFGQVAVESLACGTPVVAYNTSGLKDIISHKYNGYLANLMDVDDLARGLDWILNLDSANYEVLRQNARDSATNFDFAKIAPQYVSQYQKILNGGGSTENSY